jgi:hypothetical protein
MGGLSAFSLVADGLTWIFAALGFLHLAPPRSLLAAYRRANFSAGLPVIVGLLGISVAALLAYPGLRLWGVALAAPALFFAVVLCLGNRRYVSALPGVLLMLALVPAAASTSSEDDRVRYAGPESAMVVAAAAAK